ncbi:isochorismatase family protein [Janthinobacterium agaricidamnosum]|uniref:isochorismatase n=1 Tax=Janthinobacterium agaricidamnosum NBRC 102515 = DSM 9628 TaxID=1349767 RepID=W0V8N5_9BURK|nr:isochorismatase family protein [Janthinobacterium agaricidamnosum]CDG83718.1 isochorismatase family protein [Janthinobacterium agaricidamnosum NBRC 102515 = DSM 9628]
MTIPRIASYPMPAAGAMPSNRVDWKPDPARAVLLIHDMQEYFLDFYDSKEAPIPALLEHIGRLRAACDAAGVPVVYTAQPPEQAPQQRGLLQDWWGPGLTAQPHRAPVVAPLAPRAQDTVLVKWRYSAFVRSDLLQRMRAQGRDQLIVCGVYAHIGCLMTSADAFMNDIQPFLVGDALADFSAEQHAMALDYVSQRCGVVSAAQDVIAALRPQPASALPASLEALQAEVAQLLQIPSSDLRAGDHLLYAGLDSIRLMSLVERWRRAGSSLTFVDLAEQPTLADWWSLLTQARGN